MKEALANDVYHVTDVNDGLAALNQIKVQQPDLILLDVTMPGMNGFDVCTEIRQLYGDSAISIVMVTALEDAASDRKVLQPGCNRFYQQTNKLGHLPLPYSIFDKGKECHHSDASTAIASGVYGTYFSYHYAE